MTNVKDSRKPPPFKERREGCCDSTMQNNKFGHHHGVVPLVVKLFGWWSRFLPTIDSWRLMVFLGYCQTTASTMTTDTRAHEHASDYGKQEGIITCLT
jgi:hypothetical protein